MPAKTTVEPGQRFGRLAIVRYDHTKRYTHSSHPYYLCRCDCGKQPVVSLTHLRRGKILSCGCFRNEMTVMRETVHGHTKKAHPKGTRTFRIWMGMIKRCDNPNDGNYARYGGRGVKVCDRWREFANFLADMGEISSPFTLDRVDVDGDYCPENCRIATMKEQANNRRPYALEGDCSIVIHRPFSSVRHYDNHGMTGTKTYMAWAMMRYRCINPSSKCFHHYGGRGIVICSRWDHFPNFLEDMGEAPRGKSLDRIDVNGDYCPVNCRWATPAEQTKNRRRRIPLPTNP